MVIKERLHLLLLLLPPLLLLLFGGGGAKLWPRLRRLVNDGVGEEGGLRVADAVVQVEKVGGGVAGNGVVLLFAGQLRLVEDLAGAAGHRRVAEFAL